MYQLKIGGVPLPEMYVVSKASEIRTAERMGIPYIVWRGDEEQLQKFVLYPILTKLFPSLKWKELLGISKKREILITCPGNKLEEFDDDSSSEEDNFTSETSELNKFFNLDEPDEKITQTPESPRGHYNAQPNSSCKLTLGEYLDGDIQVDIEELQRLNLLPIWLDDVTKAIRRNLINMNWYEGYNKKLQLLTGNYNSVSEMDNLIILDISRSIPRGIADTMLVLIDTLRHRINADLIVTGAKSYYWSNGEEIPSAQELRNMIAPANESKMFTDILVNKINGRTFGHVIAFGDNDYPYIPSQDLPNGKLDINVKEVWNYHTRYRNKCGYAEWVYTCNPNVISHNNTNWVKDIKC